MTERDALSAATLALHGAKPARQMGAPLAPPIVSSNNFHGEPGGVGFSGKGMSKGMPAFYARWGGPTVTLLEDRLALLEGAESAVCFASGMGAIASLFHWQLGAGDHVVIPDVCYAGVPELAQDIAARYAVAVTAVDTSDADAVAAAMTDRTRLVHIETPANPTWRIADIAAIARIAHARGAKLSVDSTVATPIGTRPLLLGADFVVHSLSKYLGGHGDALGGAVLGGSDKMFELRKTSLVHNGATMDAFAAWRILRGLETLPLRMRQHQDNARRIVEYLQQWPRVTHVYWPGDTSHPQHAMARRQMTNFSGMLSFRAEDPRELAVAFANKLEIFSYAVSLGQTKSVIFYITTEDLLHSSFCWSEKSQAAYRAWAGEGLFRVSVGIEDPDELIADLRQASR